MALTYTPPGALGTPMPSFHLTSVDGKPYSNDDFKNTRATAILFICAHCPYVQAIEDRMIELAHSLKPQQVQFVGICSNDPTDYPEDRPEALFARWRAKNYEFPYLIDDEQKVAKAFGAVCTPDIFVFDSQHTLKYRGRFDDSWRNPQLVKKAELRMAIEVILQGQSVHGQIPSMGCSIKWKSGDTE